MPDLTIEATASALPEGWSGTPQEFADILAEGLVFSTTGDFLTGQIGGVTPTSDVGIFVTDEGAEHVGELQVWSADQAKYVPAYTIPIGSVLPYFGTGAAPDNFLFCDNADYAQSAKPELWAIIGNLHKRGGDASDHFRTPDLRGRFLMGEGPGQTGLIPADPTAAGNITERAVADYGGAEWGELKQPTQAGAATGRVVNQTRPPNNVANNTSFYSGVIPPFVCCAFIIRYR